MKRCRLMMTLAVLGCVAGSSVAQSIEDTVIREGQGPRGESLRRMERQPFPSQAGDALSRWTNSGPIDSTQTRGKVVLFVTFSSWNRSSHPALSTARRLHEQYADDGLVVIGVHDKAGWEQAAELLAARRIEYPVALDATGAFRDTLLVDQDPDFYLVDRAGQLRFADILNSEVTKAVRQLIDESEADAGSLNERIDLHKRQMRRDSLRAEQLGHSIAPGEELHLDFELPGKDVYEATRWPWRGVTWVKARRNTDDFDSDSEVVKVTFPEDNWMPAKPDMTGKVVLLYYMDPLSSHSDNVPAMMQKLQRKYPDELMVIGAVPKYDWIYKKNNTGKKEEELRKLVLDSARNNFTKIRRRDETIRHPFLVATPDVSGKNANNISIVLLGEQGRRNNTAVWLLDSQHNVRWSGYSWFRSFDTTVAKLIEADPGVQARRNAIEALKREQSQQGRREAHSSNPGSEQGDGPTAERHVDWPAQNTGRLTAIDVQGKALPRVLGKETFLTRKPDTEGKVIVLDFWATWCGPCRRASPIMDQLQRQYPHQLAVIGISDESVDTVQSYIDKHAAGYAIATDPSGNIKNSLSITGIPHVVVMSSDGIVRWQGNPLSKDFQQTVQDLIRVDPGVQ